MTPLVISNKGIQGIMQIVQFIEYSELLIKSVRETVQNEKIEEKMDIVLFYYVN